jgi:hypothetical protein
LPRKKKDDKMDSDVEEKIENEQETVEPDTELSEAEKIDEEPTAEIETSEDEAEADTDEGEATEGEVKKKAKSQKQQKLDFEAKVNHAVNRVADWIDVTEKCFNARKFPMTKEQKLQTIEFLKGKVSSLETRTLADMDKGAGFRLH